MFSTFHSVYISTQYILLKVQQLPLYIPLYLYQYQVSQCYNHCLMDSTFHSVYISTLSIAAVAFAIYTLHSTLFILVPFLNCRRTDCEYLYIPLCLYQYARKAYNDLERQTLHSTLFILVRGILTEIEFLTDYSTFHSVYISTLLVVLQSVKLTPLHSTLFILVQISDMAKTAANISTFHSVYISTRTLDTTHNGESYLYIPLCLYQYASIIKYF